MVLEEVVLADEYVLDLVHELEPLGSGPWAEVSERAHDLLSRSDRAPS